MYGETLACYGAKMCSLCHKVHDEIAWLRESPQSRFKMLQFSAELATINVKTDKGLSQGRAQSLEQKLKAVGGPAAKKQDVINKKVEVFNDQLDKSPHRIKGLSPPLSGIKISVTSAFERALDWDPATENLVDVKNMLQTLGKIQEEQSRQNWFGMLGLLMTPTDAYVAAAGKFEANTNGVFAYVAKKKGYKTCATPKKGETPSIGGANISQGLYTSIKGPSPPGSCAAPKLIQQYISDAKKNGWQIDVRKLSMSEIYFVPTTKRKELLQTAGGLYWTPGLTAHSCETCEQLLPMLLCPSGA